MAQLVKNPSCDVGDGGSIRRLGRSPGEGNGYPLQYSGLENSMDYIGSDGKASAYNEGDPGSIPGSGISPGEGNGNPLQHSCLENLALLIPRRSLIGYSPWGHKESDTTEQLN